MHPGAPECTRNFAFWQNEPTADAKPRIFIGIN
jgi:hypothetical protein